MISGSTRNDGKTHNFGGMLQAFEQDVVCDEAGAGLPVVNQLGELNERGRADCSADKLLNLTLVLDRKHERATMGVMLLKLASKVFRKQQQKFLLGTESEIRLGEMAELPIVAIFGEASVNCSKLVVKFLEFSDRDWFWRHVGLGFFFNHYYFGLFFFKPEQPEVTERTQH